MFSEESAIIMPRWSSARSSRRFDDDELYNKDGVAVPLINAAAIGLGHRTSRKANEYEVASSDSTEISTDLTEFSRWITTRSRIGCGMPNKTTETKRGSRWRPRGLQEWMISYCAVGPREEGCGQCFHLVDAVLLYRRVDRHRRLFH